MLVLMAWATSLSAQITQEQADKIVWKHVQNEATLPYLLYVYNHAPSAEGIMIMTYNEEIVKVKYACWAYYLNENPEASEPCQHRYLFVKEDNGNLLEIITSNDLGQEDLTEWLPVPLSAIDKEENYSCVVYPNPVRDELKIENGKLKIENIEIHNVVGQKQKIIFNFQFSTFNSIDISHLPAGIYFVKITTETHTQTQKIIKL